MANPNTFLLFKMTDYMLSASVQILKAKNISVYAQGSQEDIKTPAVEIQINLGTPIGHVHVQDNSVTYDSFNGTLNATVVTNRAINGSRHSEFVSKVYTYVGDLNAYNAIMPYHSILMMKPNGSVVGIQSDENTDISAVTFDFIICIRPEVWVLFDP